MRTTVRGNALLETIMALLVLTPFLGGIALLGKQLDLKHKSFDALRYSVWERTVWSERGANGKSDADIATEALDRSFGHPKVGVSNLDLLHSAGVSQNPLWQHHRHSLLLPSPSGAISSVSTLDASPLDTGYLWMPGLAHGSGPVGTLAHALQMGDLGLNRRSFAGATVEASIRPLLDRRESAQPLIQRATGALLSDAWSARDENEFGRRVDRITANEFIEALESPGRPLSLLARGKGEPIYGEGQYSWDPQLRPRSNALPSAYVVERERE
ncbi:hypothetical protein [Steroidobacter sp.]|uniref:hypothetical protein n=1 Tax=Steroidobacter sp. TaxID=1978227 RepID=UPI001A5F490B|nr:hypothetical protein [Steroidobacter sp.]MBL8265739.1 hypothetical protein [Steroidobacter sp.]